MNIHSAEHYIEKFYIDLEDPEIGEGGARKLLITSLMDEIMRTIYLVDVDADSDQLTSNDIRQINERLIALRKWWNAMCDKIPEMKKLEGIKTIFNDVIEGLDPIIYGIWQSHNGQSDQVSTEPEGVEMTFDPQIARN